MKFFVYSSCRCGRGHHGPWQSRDFSLSSTHSLRYSNDVLLCFHVVVVCSETVNIKQEKKLSRMSERTQEKAKTNILLACHQQCSLFDMNCLTFASDVDYEKLDLNISRDFSLLLCLLFAVISICFFVPQSLAKIEVKIEWSCFIWNPLSSNRLSRSANIDMNMRCKENNHENLQTKFGSMDEN